jgi:predicted DNA-binding transcriptional regulator YafY
MRTKSKTLKSEKLKTGRRRPRSARNCKGRQVYSRAPLARVMRIHQMLQSGTYPNCATIARTLEVGIKTVTRDVELIRDEMAWPIEYDAKRRGYFLTGPVPGFSGAPVTEAELFALLIAREAMTQYAGTPYHSTIEAALRKLTGAIDYLGHAPAGVSDLVSFRPFAPDKLDEVMFRKLTDAAKERHAIQFTYRKVGGAEAEIRQVQPYHIACIENHWYLLGFDVKRSSMRTFALPRIRELVVTEEAFTVPDNFDPAEYLRGSFSAYKGGDDYEVVIDFDAWASDLIRGRQWHESQKITELPDGTIRFYMRLDSIQEAQRWVLGWGVHATVVRPAALCNRIHEVCAELSGRYLQQLKAETAQPVPLHEPNSRN